MNLRRWLEFENEEWENLIALFIFKCFRWKSEWERKVEDLRNWIICFVEKSNKHSRVFSYFFLVKLENYSWDSNLVLVLLFVVELCSTCRFWTSHFVVVVILVVMTCKCDAKKNLSPLHPIKYSKNKIKFPQSQFSICPVISRWRKFPSDKVKNSFFITVSRTIHFNSLVWSLNLKSTLIFFEPLFTTSNVK